MPVKSDMATRRSPLLDHECALSKIASKLESGDFRERLSSIELVLVIYQDVPEERTVDQLLKSLEYLAADKKWEVRRASISPLLELRRPGVRNILERLAQDPNRWVRTAAEAGKKKLVRLTNSNEAASFAYEATKGLGGSSAEKIFKTALKVGERHYQEFAADIAHELNTYSAVVQGLLQELALSLGNEVLEGEAAEIFSKIRERSSYLQKLVNDLLVYTRDAQLKYEWQSLKPIVVESVELAFQKARKSLAECSVDKVIRVPGDLRLQVCRDRFERALTNVISNALEAMVDKQGELQLLIDARLDEVGRVQIAVADTGCGMDASQLADAKKRFSSGRRQRGGIGLGLPLAIKILESEHGGQMDIESDPGLGTTVVISMSPERKAQDVL